MNFEGIKNITIPEGSVKKIMRGSEILWEKVLKCTPYIVLSFKTKTVSNPTSNQAIYQCGFSIYIDGIDKSLIDECKLVMKYYRETTLGSPFTSTTTITIPAAADTIKSFKQDIIKTYTVDLDDYTYGHCFGLVLSFTDPDGVKRQLSTNFLSSQETSDSAKWSYSNN